MDAVPWNVRLAQSIHEACDAFASDSGHIAGVGTAVTPSGENDSNSETSAANLRRQMRDVHSGLTPIVKPMGGLFVAYASVAIARAVIGSDSGGLCPALISGYGEPLFVAALMACAILGTYMLTKIVQRNPVVAKIARLRCLARTLIVRGWRSFGSGCGVEALPERSVDGCRQAQPRLGSHSAQHASSGRHDRASIRPPCTR